MEAMHSPETSVTIYKTTEYHSPEHQNPYFHHHENPKPIRKECYKDDYNLLISNKFTCWYRSNENDWHYLILLHHETYLSSSLGT